MIQVNPSGYDTGPTPSQMEGAETVVDSANKLGAIKNIDSAPQVK